MEEGSIGSSCDMNGLILEGWASHFRGLVAGRWEVCIGVENQCQREDRI